jgi:hypothetical protein
VVTERATDELFVETVVVSCPYDAANEELFKARLELSPVTLSAMLELWFDTVPSRVVIDAVATETRESIVVARVAALEL